LHLSTSFNSLFEFIEILSLCDFRAKPLSVRQKMKASIAIQILSALCMLRGKVLGQCTASRSSMIRPLERSPLQIDTIYPESALTLGCLNGDEPIIPNSVLFDDWCSYVDPIVGSACGMTGKAVTCQPTYYVSVGVFCGSGLYEVRATNGTRIGVIPHVWCVPNPSSPWEEGGSYSGGKYYNCPLGSTCDMTCGYDVDWCSSDIDNCITHADSLNVGKSIAECLSYPDNYLIEACRGIEVPNEVKEITATSPSPVSKQTTPVPSPQEIPATNEFPTNTVPQPSPSPVAKTTDAPVQMALAQQGETPKGAPGDNGAKYFGMSTAMVAATIVMMLFLNS